MATRKSDLVFLILYELPGPYYLTINGFKLPTNLQVLSFILQSSIAYARMAREARTP